MADTETRTYAWQQEKRRMQQPFIQAWAALTQAERANQPVAELVRLYETYLAELDTYVEWQRMRIVRTSLP